MKFDLHVHTRHSYDSKMSTDELCAAAKAAGLSGVAVCDHNVFRAHKSRDGIYIIPACEFSTDIGHLVAYFLKSPIEEKLMRDEHGRFYWMDVCHAAHDDGALIFYAHPFSPAHTFPKSLAEHIDGIEVFNARVVHSRIHDANEKALRLCREMKKPFSAGSDAHCPSEVGRTYWECDLPDNAINEPDFEEKLKSELLSCRGRVFAGASSPFTVLACKRRIYFSKKMPLRYLKALLKLVYTLVRFPFTKKHKSGYINVHTEDDI